MKHEINSASAFLADLLRLSRYVNEHQMDVFRKAMEELMRNHYQLHWFPEKPCKGSAYRCIRINHNKMDPLLAKAALQCGIADSSLLRTLLPNELTLWVDPREVSYRIGENGSICVLYESATAKEMERYYSCKDSLRGYDNMVMDPRNRSIEQLTAFISS